MLLCLSWSTYALAQKAQESVVVYFQKESALHGGGLGLGYRTAFKSNPKWRVEFALGAGVYDAKYDKFYNEENGPYAEKGVRKTFVGIDNAAVSFTYSFDFRKKEARK